MPVIDGKLRAPIGRQPFGLLDFLKIKSLEGNPELMQRDLTVAIEALRFYSDSTADEGVASPAGFVANTASGSQAITSANWAAANLGFDFAFGGANTVVPQDEVWMLCECDVNWSMDNSGHVADFGVVVSLAGSSMIITTSSLVGFNSGTVGPASRGGARRMEQPFFALPGAQIRLFNYGLTVPAGTVTALVRLRALRLKR